jgi:tRNA(fMet)-specific endonuclease VapC
MNGSFHHPHRFLLDTNIVVAIRNQERSVTNRIGPEMEFYLPSPVLGELFSGAHGSERIHQNLQEIKLLTRLYPVLPCNAGTAEAYGRLHAYLKAKGRPIPTNDIWIASIAHQRGLTLITRDEHFRHIEHLSILVW